MQHIETQWTPYGLFKRFPTFAVASLVVIFLCVSIGGYVLNHNIDSEKAVARESLEKHIRFSAQEIEIAFAEVVETTRSFCKMGVFSSVFEDDLLQNRDNAIRLKQFFLKNKALLERIIIVNEREEYRYIYLDAHNYFVVMGKTDVNDMRPERDYVVEKVTSKGLSYTIYLEINIARFLAAITTPPSLGRALIWTWTIQQEGPIFLHAPLTHDPFAPDKRLLDAITRETQEGLEGNRIGPLDKGFFADDVMSTFYPLRINGKTIPYIYSINQSQLIAPIKKTIVSIATMFAVILCTVIYVFVSIMRKLKETEESLRAREETFHKITSCAQDAIIMMDSTGKIVFWNEAAENIFWYDAVDVLGENFFTKLVPPEQQERYQDEFQHFEDADKDFALGRVDEFVLLRKGGKPFHSEMSLSCLAINKERYFLSILRDITEKKQAKKELEENRAFLQTMIDFLPVALFVKHVQQNRFGEVILWNRMCESFFGIRAIDVMGRDPETLVDADKDNALKQLFTDKEITCFQQKIKQVLPECVINKHSGEPRTLHVVKLPILDNQGNPDYLLCIAEDISEQKRTELELKRAIDRSQEMAIVAERANIAKSKFLANMSHEIRTPLNGILGYAQILKTHTTLTGDQLKSVDTIRRSGEHLLTLINDILDLSKIEAGKMSLQNNGFHFPEFITTIREIVILRAQEKGIDFAVEYFDFVAETATLECPVPQVVLSDEQRLRQILINLIGNAVKFTDKGHVKLKIGPALGYPKGSPKRYRFLVEDTGIGIPEAEQKKIFDSFHQVASQTYKAEGTGLGLSISRKLVHMMGGELNLWSRVGQGSQFWFDIELPEVFLNVHQRIEEQEYRQACRGYQGDRKKILVVDDNTTNVDVIVGMLAPLGFELEKAYNGIEGIEKALQFKPDIILLDWIMPQMDGCEMTQQLRKHIAFQKTPIIAVSASVLENERQKMFQAGCDGFVAKPITLEILLSSLEQHLSLTWIYDGETGVPADEKGPDSAIVPPAKPIIESLLALAKMGDLEAVKEKCCALAKDKPELKPFIKKVTSDARAFRDDAVIAFLETLL
ncbi:MAG: hypothetical protein A2Y14_00855 [Verrucomicrobia bacterium GWF2_51_19]|nr:MAG: hypothetical protein A2Y14_00855 [Verrucomicrobia bacterium GWF2_51_19]